MEGYRYQAYSLHNYTRIPQIQKLPEEYRWAIEVVGRVLPFKTNNYVVNELIDWDKVPDDPIYRLNFPQPEMLLPEDFEAISSLLKRNAPQEEILKEAIRIRKKLNPHPAGQMELNVPQVNGKKLPGLQHKYYETVLFFPSQGQTCHAYCTFCFRWPQFVGMDDLKFAMKEIEDVIAYLRAHPEVSDLLFTGGDPMVMSAKIFGAYIDALLAADLPHLRNIRIGTKALAYWPYKFVTDREADAFLRIFEKIVKAGKHLSIMAHFNHPRELSTEVVRKAIERIRSTGAQIRTQSPVVRHINDNPDVWAEMWRTQVNLGLVPYYMFVARDTGAHHYFALPLVRAWEIFRNAYSQVSGLARTVRGPSMSAKPGKVQILGVSEVRGEKVFVLRFLQGRNPEWVHRPFFAQYDPEATWLDELKPAFGEEKFFFEKEEWPLPWKQTQPTAVPA